MASPETKDCLQVKDIQAVNLTEDDIPGAKLECEIVEQCSVTQLKRWLLCRGAKTSGRKAALVARYAMALSIFCDNNTLPSYVKKLFNYLNLCYSIMLFYRVKDYQNSGLDSKYLRDPDGGIHLLKKKAELGALEETDPDIQSTFPEEGFKTDISGIPNVNFGTIWRYMIDNVAFKKQLSTGKPLVKGYNFYRSGHVLFLSHLHHDGKHYIKSKVLPSMKKKKVYSCHCVLSSFGNILRCHCGCPAGVDGRCNHVAASLFALEDYCKVRVKNSKVSCTSKPCKWSIPRKRTGAVFFSVHEVH